MKLTFLGTSHGVPSAVRFCSSMLLEINGALYFIDAGAPIADMILRLGYDPNNFRAVFTTHEHGDHVSGIMLFANLLNWHYVNAAGDFYITDERLMNSMKEFVISSQAKPLDEERVRFKLAEEGVVYEDENIKAEYIRTAHTEKCFAILLTASDKRILFGGDFSQHLAADDVPKVISEPIDAFVCELAHFSMEELTPYLEKCSAKKLFFTHVWRPEKYNDIDKVKGKYPFEIITPDDCDSYEL